MRNKKLLIFKEIKILKIFSILFFLRILFFEYVSRGQTELYVSKYEAIALLDPNQRAVE